jgi:thioredoxin-dependent peroxiredoxin
VIGFQMSLSWGILFKKRWKLVREEEIMPEERIGEAFELGEQLTVLGRKLLPGEAAPDFQLDYLDPDDSSIHHMQLADSAGAVRLLNVVNSIDTPVCHIETHRWEQISSELPSDVRVYTISMDLPFALARWQSAEGVTHQVLSTHRSEQFGEAYGVLIKEWRLLQRAVFVIDRHDRLVYTQYVADQMSEPDYDLAVEAVRQALTS